MTEAQPVQSVARTFDVLEALAAADEALSLGEISRRTGLAAPTAHRLLRALQARGYAQQNDARGYRLGSALIGLGQRATPPLATLAQPALTELEEVSQETANLAVLEGELIAYIAQVPSRHRMRMFTEVGRRVLPHASGVGKAILSTLPEVRVAEIVARTGLPEYTSSTLTSEEALFADLRESRRRGFALDDGEQEIGVRCLAVALPRSNPPAAISISGPAARMTDAARLIEPLQAAARRLAG